MLDLYLKANDGPRFEGILIEKADADFKEKIDAIRFHIRPC